MFFWPVKKAENQTSAPKSIESVRLTSAPSPTAAERGAGYHFDSNKPLARLAGVPSENRGNAAEVDDQFRAVRRWLSCDVRDVFSSSHCESFRKPISRLS